MRVRKIGAVVLGLMMALPMGAVTRKWLADYASSLNGLKKAELKTAIYNLCQPKTVLNYGSGSGATWSGFYKTDRIGNTNECRNRYSTDRYYFSNSTSSISGMNIEHSFPKSWWGGSSSVNAYKDLYNLYPSSASDNSAKSNYPMGKVTNPTILDSYEKVGKGTAGSLGTITLVEPNDEWKGDFCRSYFYMATIYQNLTWQGTQGLQELENDTWPTLREWAYTLYLNWTRTDTVSTIEVERNNAVYAIQSNRNLFIDFPNLAEYVWGDSVNVAFNPNYALTSASDETRYGHSFPGEDPTDPEEPDSGDTDAKYYFQLASNVTSGKQYLIAYSTDESTVAIMTPLASTKTYGYVPSSSHVMSNDIVGQDDLTNAITITEATNGYTLLPSDGRYLYQTSTYNSFNVSESPTSGHIWGISIDADGVATIKNNSTSKSIQYSSSYSNYECVSGATALPRLYELCLVGDVNLDGEVNVADVTALVSIILGTWDTTKPHGNTNINEDATEADVSDVTALVSLILGK